MPFIDSHCHLDFAQFSDDFAGILSAANTLNVMEFVVPSIAVNNLDKVLALANQYPAIHHAFGMHPCFTVQHQGGHMQILEQYIHQYQPCAIGNIGLDYFI